MRWFKSDKVSKVKFRCLVSFSIGNKFFYEVECDVVDMDVSHIILGWPWQYDRHAMHDGHKHKYTIMKNGQKLMLNLVNMESSALIGGESSGATTLVSFKQFLHEAHGEDIYLLLVAEQQRWHNSTQRVTRAASRISWCIPSRTPICITSYAGHSTSHWSSTRS